MAAPTTSTRGTPAGIPLKDGFSSKISPAANTTVSFWEKTVQPPGFDGGDPIEQTTMHNVQMRTSASRSLITLTPMQVEAAYDPNLMNQILLLINAEGSWTQNWRDGTKVDFYAFLQKADFQALKEGEQPMVTLTIVPTNWDPVNHVEALPVITSVAGT